MITELCNVTKYLEEGYSLVAIRDGSLYKSSDRGILPIFRPMVSNQEFFKDSYVADTIIGRGAAMLLVLSGVKGVYGAVMSESATDVFRKFNVMFESGELVPYIKNRNNDGLCPIEKSVAKAVDPEQAFQLVQAMLYRFDKQRGFGEKH